MIYRNRDVRTAKNCSDIFVEVSMCDIVLWQQGTYEDADGKIVNDQIQITSLADCCRLINVLSKLKAEVWPDNKPVDTR